MAYIPAGCSCRLQPLEICVMQVLREFLQARWSQLVYDGLGGLGLDQLALTLACWLSEVSSILNSQRDTLRRSFTLACTLQQQETHGEAARMIRTLNEALTQPPDFGSPNPEPSPGSGLKGMAPPPPPLLLLTAMKEQRRRNGGKTEEEERLDVGSPSALRQVFNSESDAESFHGFPDV